LPRRKCRATEKQQHRCEEASGPTAKAHNSSRSYGTTRRPPAYRSTSGMAARLRANCRSYCRQQLPKQWRRNCAHAKVKGMLHEGATPR